MNRFSLGVCPLCILFLLFGVWSDAAGASLLPAPTGYVNDYVGVLRNDEVAHFNKLLRAYENSTSTQIVVVITDNFQGYDASRFAIEVGEAWHVGQAEHDNGVLIVLRPSQMPALVFPSSVQRAYTQYRNASWTRHAGLLSSTLGEEASGELSASVSDSVFRALFQSFRNELGESGVMQSRPSGDYGEAFIATGYGMEAYITDADAVSITRNLMGPLVVQHQYAMALEGAIVAIMEAAAGVYVTEESSDSTDFGVFVLGSLLVPLLFGVGGLLLCFFIALCVSSARYSRDKRLGFLHRGETRGAYIRRNTWSLGWYYFASLLTMLASGRGRGRGSVGGSSGWEVGGFHGGGGSFGGGGGGSSF